MNEIIIEYVALVEVLEKKRQRLPNLDSIYLIDPKPETVEILMSDFAPHLSTYRYANVFLLTACSEELLKTFSEWTGLKHLKRLTEINIGFIPVESQVFSLEDPSVSAIYYNEYANISNYLPIEDIAEKIATLCETLNEYPSIRYQRDCEVTLHLADALKKKLDICKKDEPSMGKGAAKTRTQLIILERSFDGISPLLHELTFQAMIYDTYSIKNNIYRFPHYENKIIALSEKDDLWVELRHEHIATVAKIIADKKKVFIEQNTFPSTANRSAKSMSAMMKKMPQYQKQLKIFTDYMQLIADCMDYYSKKLVKFCILEQDMAMSSDLKGRKVEDLWSSLLSLLKDKTISESDRTRLLLIHMLSNKGNEKILKEGLTAMKVSEGKKSIFESKDKKCLNILCSDRGRSLVKRKDRRSAVKFESSRWTPVVKDIMEDAITLSLDETLFPFAYNKIRPDEEIPIVVSRRGRAEGVDAMDNRSRLIVFIIGGVTYSEIRCTYEVTEQLKDWQVIIGSDCLMTPKLYLKNFQDPTKMEANEMEIET